LEVLVKDNLRRLWQRMTCRHSRTVRFYPDEAWWLRDEVVRGRHRQVAVEGCLDCGAVNVRDYGE
jgi:hypothetical protein